MSERFFYRLKPALTEAIQLTGLNETAVDFFCRGENIYFLKYYDIGNIEKYQIDSEQLINASSREYKAVEIPTYEGIRIAQIGDWLVRGIDGEIYILKDNTFRALFTYEKTLRSF